MDKQKMMARAEQLVGAMEDLPTIPAVANQVLQLLDKPDVMIEEVADLMLSDQVMTARVMKLINSPVYRPTHEIRSLRHALIFLGLRHIREVALTTSFINAFATGTTQFDISQFWEHSFGVGMVSKIIAVKAGYRDLEKAYLSGIIHDLGEVFLSQYLPAEFGCVLKTLEQGKMSLLREVENETLGTTHCEVGFCMARRWNFPEVYGDIILNHHDVAGATVDPYLCAIVNIADLFCGVRGLNYGNREWISFNLEEEPAWQILKRESPELADMDVERFCYELDDAVPDVKELVCSIFTTHSEPEGQ